MSSDHSARQNISGGLLAGAMAAAAYVGAMEMDIALSHYPSSDLQLIEGLARALARPAGARMREAGDRKHQRRASETGRTRRGQAALAKPPPQARPSRVPWVGFLGHLANGAGLGAIYALVQRWLPGPAWLRGILFSEGFLLLIWPLTPLLDRFHPLIRQGQLPPFARRIVFWQNLSRHLVFGLVLGESLRLLKQRASAQR